MLLEQELPGNPTIVVHNIEGCGSVRGIDLFAQRAEPDGLMLAALGTGTYVSYMLGNPAVDHPLPDFIPILTSSYGLIATGRSDVGLVRPELDDPVMSEEAQAELRRWLDEVWDIQLWQQVPQRTRGCLGISRPPLL